MNSFLLKQIYAITYFICFIILIRFILSLYIRQRIQNKMLITSLYQWIQWSFQIYLCSVQLCIIDFRVIWFFHSFNDIISVRPTFHPHRRTKFPWSIVIYCNPVSIILPWGILSGLGLGAWSMQVGFLCSIYVMIYQGSKCEGPHGGFPFQGSWQCFSSCKKLSYPCG